MNRKLGIILGMVATTLAVFNMAQTASAHTADPDVWPTTGTTHATPDVAESWMRPNCTNFAAVDTSKRNIDGSDVTVKTKVNARRCYGPSTGNRWVDPINVEFSYNKEGSHESCGFFDVFEGVHYDLYLKDSTDLGRNYHLPRVHLRCDTDTTGWTIESLRDAPSDFRKCVVPPQWKTNWTIEVDLTNDQSGNHGGSLWDFIGPVKDECGH